MTTRKKTPQGLEYDYIERPELPETFADSIEMIFFDGQTLRMNLCATRLEEAGAAGQATGKRYPVCRLVLSINGALELINQTHRVAAMLTQAGVLKQEAPGAKPATPQTTKPALGKTN
jgi:hypothetical protein